LYFHRLGMSGDFGADDLRPARPDLARCETLALEGIVDRLTDERPQGACV